MAFGNIFRVAAAFVAILAVLTTTGCDEDSQSKARDLAHQAWNKTKKAGAAARDAATPLAHQAWDKTKEAGAAARDAAAPAARAAAAAAKAHWETNVQPFITKQWEKAKNSEAVKDATKKAKDAIAAAAESAKNAGTAAAKAATTAAVTGAVNGVCEKWKANTQPLTDDYLIPPTCLMAMGVGSDAVVLPPKMSEKLGFPADGVATDALNALWKCSTEHVDAGSLVDRLKSGGAALAADNDFMVKGDLANPSATFCGVADDICHGCISKSTTAPAASDTDTTVLYA